MEDSVREKYSAEFVKNFLPCVSDKFFKELYIELDDFFKQIMAAAVYKKILANMDETIKEEYMNSPEITELIKLIGPDLYHDYALNMLKVTIDDVIFDMTKESTIMPLQENT